MCVFICIYTHVHTHTPVYAHLPTDIYRTSSHAPSRKLHQRWPIASGMKILAKVFCNSLCEDLLEILVECFPRPLQDLVQVL